MTFTKTTSQPIANSQAVSLDKIHNSTVLVRVSFDIPSLSDIERITDAIPTIKQLLEQNNKLILCTKWGKIKEKIEVKEMPNHPKSTSELVSILDKELKKINLKNEKNKDNSEGNSIAIICINQFAFDFGELSKNLETMYFSINPKNIILLENTHFDLREKSKDGSQRMEIAEEYAKLADFFVDEAFASSHRTEATNTEIKTLLHHTFGLSFANEVRNLEKLKNPTKPFVVIMGGAKLETKLPLLERLLPIADRILVAGLLAFTFIKAAKLNQIENLQNSSQIDQNIPNTNSKLAQKQNEQNTGQKVENLNNLEKLDNSQTLPEIFDSKIEEDFVTTARELLKKYKEKIILPSDFVYDQVSRDGKNLKLACDIGDETIANFGVEIKKAKTLFWNGPMGFFEKPPFDAATHQIAQIITQSQCFSVLGGGDTNAALGAEILAKFSFVSMAGGATLDFLSR